MPPPDSAQAAHVGFAVWWCVRMLYTKFKFCFKRCFLLHFLLTFLLPLWLCLFCLVRVEMEYKENSYKGRGEPFSCSCCLILVVLLVKYCLIFFYFSLLHPIKLLLLRWNEREGQLIGKDTLSWTLLSKGLLWCSDILSSAVTKHWGANSVLVCGTTVLLPLISGGALLSLSPIFLSRKTVKTSY